MGQNDLWGGNKFLYLHDYKRHFLKMNISKKTHKLLHEFKFDFKITLGPFGVPLNHRTSKNIQLVYSKWWNFEQGRTVFTSKSRFGIFYRYIKSTLMIVDELRCYYVAGRLLPEIVGNSREEFPWIFGAFPTSYNFTVLLLR